MKQYPEWPSHLSQGGTYSVIFNAQYAIDPSDRTAQTAADMRRLHYLEGGRIYGNYCRRHPYQNIYTRCLYGGRCRYRCGKCYYYIRWQRSLHFRFGAAFSMGANVIIVDRGATAEDVFWIAEVR
jgi:hypothetical protein